MYCTTCGTDQPSSATTCAACGSAAPRQCPRCRAPSSAAARFCAGCGEPLAPAAGAAATVDELRTVTVLFADVSGSTALSAQLEPDEVKELMDRCFDAATRAVRAEGGTIDKYIGDCVMALFGAPTSHGDDAARAVRAAVAVQRATAELSREIERERGLPVRLRIGLHTGKVLAGLVGSRDFTVMGEPVAVAKRLESACPVGSVLISAETYRQVRGLFDVWARDPVHVKGRREPVPVYEVLGEREGGAVVGVRGVEGIETPLVGRGAELARLVEEVSRTIARKETRLVLVEGVAGIGKSRLAHALRVELEDRPRPVARLEARGLPYDAAAPYALLSRLLRSRAGPATDAAGSAAERLAQLFVPPRRRRVDADAHAAERRRRAGAVESERRRDERRGEALSLLPEGVAQEDLDALALLLEIDRPAATGAPLLDVEALAAARARGCAAAARILVGLAGRDGLVLLVEDLHLCDEASLAFLGSLAGLRAPILVLGLARPELAEAQPGVFPGAVRLPLLPLPEAALRELCHHIFRLAPALPEPLERELVARAAGNPYFLEELVKDLVERGVVRREAGADGERWEIGAGAITALRLPQSVEALIQARLDRLPASERELLRRAAVLGRTFWDQALAELTGTELPAVQEALGALSRKELVRPRESSRFAGVQEWIFVGGLVRDVAYASLPRKERADSHRAAARFLEARGGGTSHGLLPALARHLELAGDARSARARYASASDAAAAVFAHREALALLSRALELEPEAEERFELLERRARLLDRLGRRTEQLEAAQELERLGPALSPLHVARALRQRARLRLRGGDLEGAEEDLLAAESAFSRAGDLRRACLASVERAHLSLERGLLGEALARAQRAAELARRVDDRGLEEGAVAVEGTVLLASGDPAAAAEALGRARDLARASRLPDRELLARMNLALCQLALGEVASARAALQAVVVSARALGLPAEEAYALANLADAARHDADAPAAIEAGRRARELGERLGDARILAAARVALALAFLLRGGRTDLREALLLARAAAAAPHPALVAAARMVEARALLSRGDAQGATVAALDAVSTADRLGGLEDHEPLLRWTLVQALVAAGREPEALVARERARVRLRELAARIGDPAARRAFLDRVPLHREINEVTPATPPAAAPPLP